MQAAKTPAHAACNFADSALPDGSFGIGADRVGCREPPNDPSSGFIEGLLLNGIAQRVHMPGISRTLASLISRLAQLSGNDGFIAFGAGPLLRVCIQFAGIDDIRSAGSRVLRLGNQLVGLANTMNPLLVAHGGGCKSIDAHPGYALRHGACLEVALVVDIARCSNCRGISGMVAGVAQHIEPLIQGRKVGTSITRIADQQLLCAQITLQTQRFAHFLEVDALAGRIVDLHTFICARQYRTDLYNARIVETVNAVLAGAAATHTGPQNSWTAQDRGNTALAVWYCDHRGRLCGRIAVPVVAVQWDLCQDRQHPAPAADACPGLQPINHAAAIGLACSLASLHAHATDAIAAAEPARHARDLALLVGARGAEVDVLVRSMPTAADIRSDRAVALLDALRSR